MVTAIERFFFNIRTKARHLDKNTPVGVRKWKPCHVKNMYNTLFIYVARVRDVFIKNIDLQKFKHFTWQKRWNEGLRENFYKKQPLGAGKRYTWETREYFLDTNINIIVRHERALSFLFLPSVFFFMRLLILDWLSKPFWLDLAMFSMALDATLTFSATFFFLVASFKQIPWIFWYLMTSSL